MVELPTNPEVVVGNRPLTMANVLDVCTAKAQRSVLWAKGKPAKNIRKERECWNICDTALLINISNLFTESPS